MGKKSREKFLRKVIQKESIKINFDDYPFESEDEWSEARDVDKTKPRLAILHREIRNVFPPGAKYEELQQSTINAFKYNPIWDRLKELIKQGRYEEGIAHFNENMLEPIASEKLAADLKLPTYVLYAYEAYNNLGYCYNEIHQTLSSINAYTRALFYETMYVSLDWDFNDNFNYGAINANLTSLHSLSVLMGFNYFTILNKWKKFYVDYAESESLPPTMDERFIDIRGWIYKQARLEKAKLQP